MNESVELATKLRDWFLDEGLVANESPPLGLGIPGFAHLQKLGAIGTAHHYLPGPLATEIVDIPLDVLDPSPYPAFGSVSVVAGLPGLVVWPNGAEFGAHCPTCEADDIDAFFAGVSGWMDWKGLNDKPTAVCSTCQTESSVVDLVLTGPFALSLIAITFHYSWEFADTFSSEMLHRLGGNARLVSGRY